MDGARMQEIADEAGINKALLHYYFRSKEKLFESVFEMAFRKIFKVVNESIRSGNKIEDFIEVFTYNYLKLLTENPYLPNFTLNEISRNPARVKLLLNKIELDTQGLSTMIEENIRKGNIIPVSVSNLMVDLLGMCILSVAGKPIIQRMFFAGNNNDYEDFLNNRAKHISKLMISALTNTSTYESL